MYNGVVHQLLLEFKKAYDSVRRQELQYILTEFYIIMKIVMLRKCVTRNL